MRRHRLPLAAASLLALSVAVGGCSASGSSPSGSASASTNGQSSSPASSTEAATGASTSQDLQKVLDAAANTQAAGSADFKGVIDLSGGAATTNMTFDGQVDFSKNTMKGSVTSDITGQNLTMQVLTIDDKTYAQMPMLGDKWIKTPDSQGTGGNPLKQIDSLKRVTDLKEVGTDDVDGVTATHYKGSIDLTKALEAAGFTGEQLDAAKQQLGKSGQDASLEVWVDPDGRIVKMSQHVSLDAAGKQGSLTSTVSFSNFGTSVDVTPPSPDQVIDSSQLQSLDPNALAGAGSGTAPSNG